MTGRRTSVVILLVAVVAACSGGDDSAGGEGDQNQSAVVFGDFGRDQAEVDGNLTMPSVDDLIFVEQAEGELIRSCMEEAGFEYVPNQVDGMSVSDPMDIGMPSPAYLRSFGYGSMLDPTIRSGVDLEATRVTLPPTPNDEIVGALPRPEATAWREALSGPEDGPSAMITLPDGTEISQPTEGCFADAIVELYGSINIYLNFQNGSDVVVGEANDSLTESEDYLAVVTEWYQCMTNAGYDPGGQPNGGRLAWEAYRDLPVEQAAQEEMTIAAVDADCQEQVGLPAVLEEVRAELLRDAAANQGFDLMGRQEVLQGAVARAREVITSGG